MLDWSDLQHFLAVQRSGTLAGAARALRVDATTVGRRLAALEHALGAQLFERGAGRYALTAAGQQVVQSVEGIDALSLAVQRSVAAEGERVTGVVRVALTEAMAVNHVLPHVGDFHARFPQLELELVTGNPSVSLSRRDADLAVRLMRPDQPGLFAKRAAAVAIAPYAAKRYLQKHGAPAAGYDGHQVIAYTAEARSWPEAQWLDARAKQARVALRVNSVFAAAAAVRAGLGIGLLPCGTADLLPELERIGGPARALEREVWLAVHQDLRKSPRVRAAWDWLTQVLEAESRALRG